MPPNLLQCLSRRVVERVERDAAVRDRRELFATVQVSVVIQFRIPVTVQRQSCGQVIDAGPGRRRAAANARTSIAIPSFFAA